MGGVLRLRQSATIVAVASSLVIFAFLLSYSLSASVRFPCNLALLPHFGCTAAARLSTAIAFVDRRDANRNMTLSASISNQSV